MDKIISSFLLAVCCIAQIAQYIMFVRAILSWLPNLNTSKFSYFLYQLTEPLVMPVRKILSKTSMGNSMIDISFFITFLLLILVQDLAYTLFVNTL